MKKTIVLFSLTFVLFVQLVAGSPDSSSYSYLGKPITEKRFKLFYKYLKDFYYADVSGKVYCREYYTILKNMPTKAKAGDFGEVSGKVFQVVDDNRILLNVSYSYIKKVKRSLGPNVINTALSSDEIDMRPASREEEGVDNSALRRNNENYSYEEKLIKAHYLSSVILPDAKKLINGRDFSCVAVMKGVFHYQTTLNASNSIPEFELLHPVTEAEFKSFLDKGNQLYYFKKKYTPAKYKTCPKCKGVGAVPVKPHSVSMKKCPACNGKRKIQTQFAKLEYLRLPLNK